jgi:hypothetical protein
MAFSLHHCLTMHIIPSDHPIGNFLSKINFVVKVFARDGNGSEIHESIQSDSYRNPIGSDLFPIGISNVFPIKIFLLYIEEASKRKSFDGHLDNSDGNPIGFNEHSPIGIRSDFWDFCRRAGKFPIGILLE